MAEDKGFKPSQKKIKKAAKEGQHLKSALAVQLSVVIGILFSTFIALKLALVNDHRLLEYFFQYGYKHPLECFQMAIWEFLKIGLSSSAAGILIGVLIEGLQVGFRFESSLLSPRGDRFSFAKGLKRLSSGIKQQSWQYFLRLLILLMVVWINLRGFLNVLSIYVIADSTSIFQMLRAFFCNSIMSVLAVMIVLALADYLLKRRNYYRDLSMSLEEVRREHKEDEGDPHMRGMRKAIHLQLAQQELVNRVRRSKVIITD